MDAMAGGAAGGIGLPGLRVLVAEDRSLVAGRVAQILRRAGCAVVGPAATLAAGLDLAQSGEAAPDAAVLDIDLRGEPAYPLAEALRARGVPFLFLTGYGEPVIPARWRPAVRVEKPFSEATLLSGLRSAIAKLPGGAAAPPGPAEAEPAEAVRRAWKAIRSSRDLLIEGRIVLEPRPPGPKR